MSEQQKKTRAEVKQSRKEAILQALAVELEQHPGERITTAQLAKRLAVSEAALYRHFPSKARMYEELIDFAEETILGLIHKILQQETQTVVRCEKMLMVLLQFSTKNPGISSILVGTALTGEREKLRQRVNQFFERLETQLKQILREGELTVGQAGGRPVAEIANLLLSIVEGHIQQFVRSGFRRSPIQNWSKQWPIILPILAIYQ